MKLIERGRGGTHFVRLPMVVAVALFLVIAIGTIVLWSTWRTTSIHLRVKNPGNLDALLPSMAGLSESNIDRGNRVQLLENGDAYFPLLLSDIARARESVHVETYIWWKGAICRQLATLLAQKAKQGVEVRLMVDASGGHKMDRDLLAMMQQAGCRVAFFHPFHLSNLGRLNNRDHRKDAIIDGRIGYVGGYGIASEWTGHAQDRDHWRDSGLRLEGPIVNRLQSAFCENWIEETGEIPAGDKYFPHTAPAGPTLAHIAYTSPHGSISSVQVLYYLAIKAARHEIIIQNPYLLPNQDALDALADAIHRGVSVKIMVPSTSVSDGPIVQHAGHHHFGNLLRSGVRVWEYRKTLLHQKVIIVDGVWACIGSTNFDDRSFVLNDEISIGVLDPVVAGQLRAAFEDDLRDSQERHLDEWTHRSLWHKLIDALAYLGNNQL